MTDLLERFIPEARDYLDGAMAGLLKLERTPDDEGLINEVFRAVHTLKGASGLFDIPGFTRLVHAGEDLLGAVRAGQLKLESSMVDRLLGALDLASCWVDSLESAGRLPIDADTLSAERSKELWALVPSQEGAATMPRAATASGPPDWLLALPDAELQPLLADSSADIPLLAITYQPDEGCFYRGEDPFALLMQLDGLKWLRVAAKAPAADLADIDPFRSLLRFHALALQPRAEVDHLVRYVVDQVAIHAVPVAAEAALAHFSSAADHKMAVRILAEQRRVLALSGEMTALLPRLASVETVLLNICASLGQPAPVDLAAALDQAKQGAPAALIALIGELEARLAPDPGRLTAEPPPLRRDDAPALAAGDGRPMARLLRVEQAKVDRLMTLIAELVVSKNSLPFLAQRAEGHYGSRDMGREIKDHYAVVDRLAQEMQRAILDVRMLPVSEIFDRFPRLVRDLSRKLGKQIELKIIGEDTAADKTIIEALGDPMIHLLRNAIDHGIETPDQRSDAGKPERANILLRAAQEGDQVIIEVSDDGRGIDPRTIRAKAIEKGLISEAKADSLSDQEAINLIFLPGFSTAAAISDLSGRGVGMDVVRTAIEKINGSVQLSSRKGEGTLIRLSLPLSMAVSRVMMVEVGSGLFGVPLDGVVETVRVARTALQHIKTAEAFILRDALLPLFRLRHLLDLPPDPDPPAEEAVLVVRVAGASLGLVVDRVREGIDVILKPMDGLLATLTVYSGSALLGDGRVLLILNLKELLACRSN